MDGWMDGQIGKEAELQTDQDTVCDLERHAVVSMPGH